MPVEAEDRLPAAVEVEAVLAEDGRAESGPGADRVRAARPAGVPGVGQGRADRVQLRLLRRPVAHRACPADGERDGVRAWPADTQRRPGGGQRAVAVEQGGGDGRGPVPGDGAGLDGRRDPDGAAGGEHVPRQDEDVLQVNVGNHLEPHVPVDAGRLQVVHGRRPAGQGVRRDVEPAAVHDDGEHVAAAPELAGELGRPGQVAAGVRGHDPAVEHDGGVRHDPVEGHEHPAARHERAVEVLAVDPGALPGPVVPAGPGQVRDGVRQRDARVAAVVVPGRFRAPDVRAAEQPALVEVVASHQVVKHRGDRARAGAAAQLFGGDAARRGSGPDGKTGQRGSPGQHPASHVPTMSDSRRRRVWTGWNVRPPHYLRKCQQMDWT